MLIDWFTVIAQIVNFLILVWLLKRFLYGPILKALDAREKRIAAILAAADAKGLKAEKERSTLQEKNDEFDQQRAMLLSRASYEAEAERQRLIAAARKEADDLRARREDSLKREYRSLNEAITRRIGAEVVVIARKVLADLANTTLEAHMVSALIKQIRELSPEEKVDLVSTIRMSVSASPVTAAAASAESAGILVRSAFDLPAVQQNAIEITIKEILDTEIPVRFESRPDLVSGIELIMRGYKIAWSIENYLVSLEKEIGALLKKPDEPRPEFQPVVEAETEAEASETRKKHEHKETEKSNTPDQQPSPRHR
ncbi:MAG: F0F1 ATP synthase subunit B [Nitrosospira sp.]